LFQFAYRRHADQDRPIAAHHRVIVVGAGPVGLTLSIDLALRGHAVLLLDDADRIGEGSRAICFSKRSLELWDRLGVARKMLDKGVVWKVGKVFLADELVYQFDLLPESGHKMPAFINLQQYYAEQFLVERAADCPGINLRWRNKVTGVEPLNDHVAVSVQTPDGVYRLTADYLVACDGARSSIRTMLGADFVGEAFEDQFLIADVKMQAQFPPERWFWFDPPFHSGQSALLHRQPDDTWRIDLQLGRDADPELERRPERVRPRIARMLGHDRFEFAWVSLYRFQCRRMQRFVHGRVVFAGDAAHQVSPFGARGANSGLEDAENLAWKLDLVQRGLAGEGLLASYDAERGAAADENIRHSTRATDFIAPRSPHERLLRNATLALARRHEFAKRMVNAGRLSVPCVYDSALSTPDDQDWGGGACPGTHMPDAPVAGGFLSEAFTACGRGFTLLRHGDVAADSPLPSIALTDADGDTASRRFAMRPGSVYLLRPDGYVAARFRAPSGQALGAALRRAHGFAQAA